MPKKENRKEKEIGGGLINNRLLVHFFFLFFFLFLGLFLSIFGVWCCYFLRQEGAQQPLIVKKKEKNFVFFIIIISVYIKCVVSPIYLMHLTSIYLVLAAMAPLFFVRPIFSLFLHRKKRNGPRTSLRILSHFGWRTHKRKKKPSLPHRRNLNKRLNHPFFFFIFLKFFF